MKIKKFKIILSLLAIFLIFPEAASAATLSLSPSGGTFNKNCNYAVDILIDTKGADTDGTDTLLKYDPAKIKMVSVIQGNVYPDYPTASFDPLAGTISISGLSSVSTPFNGTGKFATLNLSVNSNINNGDTAAITFDFVPSNPKKTTDSNVVQSVTVVDILDSVVNGVYTLGIGNCTSPGSVTPGGGGTITPGGTTPRGGGTSGDKGSSSGSGDLDEISGSNVPPGTASTTIILSILGSLFVVLGIAGLALL